MLVLDMIEILPPLGKYKYDTWRIFPVKCYIDNSMRLWSCIRNVNTVSKVSTPLPLFPMETNSVENAGHVLAEIEMEA
jgi:hypothetical protein